MRSSSVDQSVAVAQAEIEKQEAKVKDAKEEVKEAKEGVKEAKEEVKQAEAKVKEAEVKVKEAEVKAEKAKEHFKEAKTKLEKEAAQKGLDSAQKGLDSAQKGLDSAQKGLDSAQKGLDSAQEGVKTAQRLWNIAVASLERASGAAGGAQAASGQGGFLSPAQVLKDFFEEQRMRDERQHREQRTRDERQHREQLQLLRHLTQPQNPWAEMARTSAASDTSSQQRFRTKLADFYSRESSGDRKRKVKCAVTGMEDATEGVRVVAAHIWPKSAAATFPLELTDGVNHPSNGIFFHECIEEVFDQLRVCLVCNPFKISATFVVLDEDVMKKNLKGTNRTFSQLHGQQLEFEKGKRPSFQLLSRHAQQAFSYSGNKHWMSEEDLSSFKSVLQVGSPQK